MFKNLTSSRRSWLKTVIWVVGLLTVAIVFGQSNDSGSPLYGQPGTQTQEASPSTAEEEHEHEGDEHFGEPEYSKADRTAIRVAERVARHYGGFPSQSGDLEEVIPAHLQRLKPVVTERLREQIRAQWNQGRLWSLTHFKTEVRPGSYFKEKEKDRREVVVTISKTLVNPTTENVPVEIVYLIRVQRVDGKFLATSIADGEEKKP